MCVVGLGYIGLPTASMLARAGLRVTGVDLDRAVVDAVNAGEARGEEHGLAELVGEVVAGGQLRATPTPVPADAFVIAVPTPLRSDGTHGPDLSRVRAAGIAIAPSLKRGDLVVLESTSPVGTTAMLAGILADARPDLSFPHEAGEGSDIRLAYCPERVVPGRMLHELVHNDRIIGGMTRRCAASALALYGAFAEGECRLTDDRTAEMVKLAENAFRDVNLAFANELSMVCYDLGLDPWRVIELANRHPRVSILNPGPGVGGHCVAVDPWFIVASAPERATLVRTAREVNDAKARFVVEQVREAARGMERPTIACLGLAYKPDVDDFRDSPALEIA
ncbi:MAG: UDP-N-acetyl-D-mannosamine dehydrogenase, partial [Alphaproteobacteria bacterium]